ncbi:hypothetical protein AN964_09945 [Heyndrickxia shackletonii]|uniref:Uncharacterized protein n=1 Tax=Heyndrickxia shackletonii TaxID=157838 RepID=A0A0Q3TIN1_9BACI|nr:hypothetical protein [Heyndrickxia shackletonii]KQL53790.1 hypothetical protein AN964_09945 [Heyndrickxia shackletonii]MBB2481607.1 hypothetical protein [Bacillus sp. APMAM]NEZ02270.1 hypothetical protein [Heyndrickxia shackletonii]RTZ55094.1 hypothetical protein EKO25_14850 [Bacillus sp. SAJ1]
MNIKEYYTVMSRIYLNQIILVGFFLIGCLFLFNAVGFPFILKIIFIIVMIILIYFFVKYLYFNFREGSLKYITSDKQIRNENSKELMMMFLPAPSLFIKFFNSNGICEYELRDEGMEPWKWFLPIRIRRRESLSYQLKKRDGTVLVNMNVSQHNGQVEITTPSNQLFIIKLQERKRKMMTFEAGNDMLFIHLTTHKIEVTKNNKNIATIQNGWMPIKWQKYFSSNTPILTFKNEVSEAEQFIIYGLLIFLFVNQFN